ncbi:MAG: 2-hydroxyacyl-CoA dehydratase [Dehalococcoidia bacterium]|nr:2-hydroxyacyl-CoA dehydratase [Dehalococcoidia bacterium]
MIEDFRQYRQSRHQEIIKWKLETGKRVMGVFCCNVPEEIIYAADMLPVRILGEHEETTEADLHFPVKVCPYPKSCFDQALKGRYDYLDGLVVPNVCDMIRAMYGFWKRSFKLPYIYFLEVPQKISTHGVDFFLKQLILFKESLENFSGKEITRESLLRAIEVYNENRALLSKAYEFRKGSPRLSGVETQEIVLTSMLMPKESHNRLLSQLLDRITNRDDAPKEGVRLFVSASMLDDTDFFQLIEECGGNIVADDMPTGSRYFFNPVDTTKEPLDALAERYLARIPCPRKMRPEARFDHVREAMRGAEAKGVIIHNLRACDCHLYEYPYLKEKLEGEGLPVLFFRGEETETERERQRDDIEAFIEMLRG